MNILVAVDLSSATDKIIEAARGVADLTGATIHVLHVVEADPEKGADHEDAEKITSRVGRDFPLEYGRVRAIVETLQNEGLDASACLLKGPAVKLALSTSNRLGAGLVIVGSHGRNAVLNALIGSFSAGMIRKSKVPVLVIPVRNESPSV